MRVVILTIGSRGDVAPYTGVAARLRTAGHDVAIATETGFADMVRATGCEFRPMSSDTRSMLSSEEGREWQRGGTGLRGIRNNIRMGQRLMANLGEDVVRAAEGAEVLLLQRGVMVHGYLVAKAMGVPSMALELFPGVPTAEFPLPSLGGLSLGPRGTRLLTRLAAHMPTPFDGAMREFCQRLGLPPTRFAAVRAEMLENPRYPILHGFSPSVVPRPGDWRPGVDVVGYWWPERAPGWEPPPALVDFLAAGPAPVFVGFGSMSPGESERLSGIVSAALRRARVRGVVQAGWAGMTADGDDVLTVDTVPHDWLFPQMAAVVHHGGAGTTGAGLRAGVPAVLTPVLADQPWWAERLRLVGVSPGSAPLKELSVERLASLIRQAVTDESYRRRARALARRIAVEDGAGKVVMAVERIERAGGR
ncbi:UDP:flavonoid glycosyltransferase YjiC, YdhE family [Streptoalloteichus tenebrarius]|uniref:UDP:flavonoid glycosyltransferase YjiC, YdhE family n=1 Tax=Streptoalloteichus tenebrarius (strain ATCC 17920 / DSM 40477 / JCM 4838 / CBS 697.72 / NBRC 16177 / NCIMB 11028 / NRRL B-12390 / A12253. 1 / ISP 5477) TaxID=1933 RepID=A0ABT1HS98_STRSD|nr:glycosyltransferase [Streptoalloteichus tenebrarius]MCP2258381.1 UDP:flavonoid glycosyltransferase YjiC, YdhE family [Streptoalloteichus tenebrarius]BFF03548.1 glycosyltransferase [Streptoalloteichus tenebrarius]